MHRFLQQINDRDVISRRPHEVTLSAHDSVGKIVRAQWASSLRLHAVEGVPAWRHLHWLTPEETESLELDGDPWLLAVRDHIEGRTLREAWLDDRQARNIALRLTYRLRDLHEQGMFHGDLQPSNVIVDSAGDVWLIDVALLTTTPGDAGHVAGSAALMAPELWEGAPPSTAADTYAHGCLVSWLLSGHYPHHADDVAGWAEAHRAGKPDLDGLPAGIAGAVRRMLARDPTERAALQELVDALLAIGADAPLPPTTAARFDLLGDLDDRLSNEGTEPSHVAFFAPRRAGKSQVADRLALRAAHARRRVVLMRGALAVSTAVRPATAPHTPWSPVLELLRGIAEPAGTEPALPPLLTGDRLHALERLTEAVIEAAGDEPLLIIWDDFDQLRPDAHAWWAHFRGALDHGAHRVSTVVLGTEERDVAAVRHELLAPSPARWARWRARTLRAEVRGVAQARWERLVTECGATIGGFLSALDSETGARVVPRPRAETRDTATLGAVDSAGRSHQRPSF